MDIAKLIDLQGLQTYDENLESEKLTPMKSDIQKNSNAIGDITQLNTTAKTDVVAAINEVKNSIGEGFEIATTEEINALFA